MNTFREQIYRVFDKDQSEHIPFIVAGNKCDLENERQVVKTDAEKLAKEWGIKYIETSAKAKINVSELFEELVRDIEKNKPADPIETKPEPTTNSCCVIM